MNRTRRIFFGFLVVYLGIIATTLSLHITSPMLTRQIFIGSTIFSIGVVLLDFLGILGGHHSGETTGDVIAGDVTAGHFGGDPNGGIHLDIGHGHGDGHADIGHAPTGEAAAGHAPGDQATAQASGETHPAVSQQSPCRSCRR